MVPLVAAVAFGLLSSTLMIIFVMPSALAIYFDFFDVKAWLRTRVPDRPGNSPVQQAVQNSGIE